MGCIKGERFRLPLFGRWPAVLLLIIALVLCLSGCGGGGHHSAQPLPGYLQNCLVDGKVVRWTRMPINVYIDRTNPPANWKPVDEVLFKDALDEWSAASQDRVRFAIVSSSTIPCITVRWVRDHPLGEAGAAGVAKLDSVVISGKNFFQDVQIEIATTSPSSLPFADISMRITSLHELGHALGLWGHSDNPDDIMFTTGPAAGSSISARDALTLNALYSLTPDVSEVPAGSRARKPSSELVLP